MNTLDHPVYTGPPTTLRRAQAFLKNAGIDSRVTKSRKQCGLLKVTPSNADRTRQVLQQFDGPGRIMASAEASFFFCHSCQAPLSMGSVYCKQCGEFVGDAHAM